ncbi:16S rRNA (cytosine(1402)-N(4))-methyltransferase RsmH [Candidatus Saccharibacteria bacterium]|jgi:16S rRNA (cytosine1402-N4)-methyltransferase|nr:16S rRNA (cytosine(1402)-N(4))-methyltransferase RsmH [Candidatus Saccharibacteria bacterium]
MRIDDKKSNTEFSAQDISSNDNPPQHIPVLLDASLRLMSPKSNDRYLDLTAGLGGHARAFLSSTGSYKTACLVDRDSSAIASLNDLAKMGTRLIHSDFLQAINQLKQEQQTFDLIMVDLGVSSPQLDKPERGFSFMRDGPLDMRMDQTSSLTAAEFINSSSHEQLVHVIVEYGEEPIARARRYAKAIGEARPLSSTAQLAKIIADAHVGGWQRIHPATRTFQAIRIAINQELSQIEAALPILPSLLNSGGRLGIISFHSLEDRLVKQFFNDQAKSGYEAELAIVTKKPISGTEDVHNLRARSAKLRVAVKK